MSTEPVALRSLRFLTGYACGSREAVAICAIALRMEVLRAAPSSVPRDSHDIRALQEAAEAVVSRLFDTLLVCLREQRQPVFGEAVLLRSRVEEGAVLVHIAAPYAVPQAFRIGLDHLLKAVAQAIRDDRAVPESLEVDTAAPDLVSRLRPFASRQSNQFHLLRAIYDSGVEFCHLPSEICQIGYGPRSRWLSSTLSDGISALSRRIAGDKAATSRLLRRSGVPMPDHVRVTSRAGALRAFRVLGPPVVVKPCGGEGGRGVTANITVEAELASAFDRAVGLSPTVLVERYVEGNDFRLTVAFGELLQVFGRKKQGVIGDGVSPISELIAQRNATQRRDRKLIVIDTALLARLEKMHLTLDSIPAEGAHVALGELHNVSAGGVRFEVAFEQVHPAFRQLALAAAQVLRLDIAGIDIIARDIGAAPDSQPFALTEVNANPELAKHEPAVLDRFVGFFTAELPSVGDRRCWILSPDSAEYSRLQQERAGDAPVAINRAVIGEPSLASRNFLSTVDAARALLNEADQRDTRVVLTPDELFSDGLPFSCFRVISVAKQLGEPLRSQCLRMVEGHAPALQ